MLTGISESLFHPEPVADSASSAAFRFILELRKFSGVAFVVIAINDEADFRIIEIVKIALKSVKPSFKFFIGIDVGIGKEDRDPEVLSQILQRIDRTDSAADVNQKFGPAFQFAYLFVVLLQIIHLSKTWNRQRRRNDSGFQWRPCRH